MKKFALYAFTLAALVGAGVALASASPSAKLDKQDRVYGGGQFGPGCFTGGAPCFDYARNFAVDAHAQGDGSEAVGNSTYGTPGSVESYRKVTCLRALLPSTRDRDLASPEYVDPLDSANWPAGFPTTCPSPTSGFPAGLPVYREVDEGDVVVQDAPGD